MSWGRWVRGAGCVLVLTGCRLSPLTNRIDVGEEPFVVFVGEGPGDVTDLFASAADGGEVVQVTFTRERESAPALDPTGGVVAFLRRGVGQDATAFLVLMNLVNSGERELRLPGGLGDPSRLGWSRDGRRVFLGTSAGVFVTAAPPAPLALAPIPRGAPAAVEAESALAVLLGEPAFARVVPCAVGSGVCVESRGLVQPLAEDGHDPLRWGRDSVAYLTGATLVVRPLGPGRSRRLQWARPPDHPRQATYFGGKTS